MGLIIGKSGIPMFKVGYPTVSDKYNVAGGILSGEKPVKFGELVKFSSTKGYYEAITDITDVANIAGFVLATNVKLASEWPAKEDSIKVLPGEAFNLALSGSYLAIELASNSKEEKVKPNGKVYVITNSGSCTTEETDSSIPYIEELPGVVFTGMVEKHGKTLVAEVYVK